MPRHKREVLCMGKTDFLKDFGKRIAILRISHHETQKDLERALGDIISNREKNVDGSIVGKWERGEREMNHLELEGICRRYHADANELLGLLPQQDILPKHRLDLSLKKYIGHWMSEYRRLHHETQTELAEVLKCKGAAISKYETGINAIPISKFKTVCERYKIDAHYLLRLPQTYKKAKR